MRKSIGKCVVWCRLQEVCKRFFKQGNLFANTESSGELRKLSKDTLLPFSLFLAEKAQINFMEMIFLGCKKIVCVF